MSALVIARSQSRDRLPDFIIIGAMRAGTTSLAERLSAHPEVGMSRLKETDFFVAEKNFSRGLSWYRSLFPANRSLLGEASPNYTKSDVFKGVPERIRSICPAVKLVYLVRDPVQRFWSHYTHSALVHGGMPPPETVLDEDEGSHILASSMYARQLKTYLDFFPARQILVADLEEIKGVPAALADLLKFIGASPDPPLPLPSANSSGDLARMPGWALKVSMHPSLAALKATVPPSIRNTLRKTLVASARRRRETSQMPRAVRARVEEALAADVAKLRDLTGRQFAHWSI